MGANHSSREAEVQTFFDEKKFGRILKGYRNMAGLFGEDTVEELRKQTKMSISSRTLYEYERGTGRLPTIDTVLGLMAILDIDADAIISCVTDEVALRKLKKLFGHE